MQKLLVMLLLVLTGCSHIKYVEVPVEKVRTEYVKNEYKDSVLVYVTDSSATVIKNDTVQIEKYRTIYRDRQLYTRDTLLRRDTIPVVQKVTEIKEVNKLKGWQRMLMIAGGLGIGGLGLWIYRKIRK